MELIAEEVMRRAVQTVPPTMTLPELERRFQEARVTGFPVLDAGQLVGVVSRADIVRQLLQERETAERTSDFYRDGNEFVEVRNDEHSLSHRIGERMEQLTVAEVMHPAVHVCPPDQALRAVAATMIDNDIHRVLVTQEGNLLGIISVTDFARLYAQGRLIPSSI